MLIENGPFVGLRRHHYSALLVDPPYKFQCYSEKGEGKSPQRHYRCYSPERIAAMFPVADLVTDDAVLFLWVPGPQLFKTEAIIEAWGFRYSGYAWLWIKRNDVTGKFSFGGGFGTRKNGELCLLGRRGHPKVLSHSVRDLIVAPRREHSRKPDEQYACIEALFAGPRLELFARQRRPGWTSWGDEA